MSSYPLSNVLLPAVIISSAVFSTLTLPFAFIKKEPLVVELPPFFSGEIQPLFNGEHKDVAIPYVGFAIVVSVGAGMASVEVSRRWQAYRESASAQKQEQNFQPDALDPEIQQNSINRPEYRPEIEALELPLRDELFSAQSLTSPDAIAETPAIPVDNLEQQIDAAPLIEYKLQFADETPIGGTSSELENSFSPLSEDDSGESEATQSPQEPAVQGLNSAASTILESRHLYQRCRIRVPHLERRLLAILVEGQYYSFFRAEATQEKVLEIIAKLSYKIQKTIITKTEKGYFIWAWEPEAKSEL
jgi:hypothetical protein